MADITITIPDNQVTNVEKHLFPHGADPVNDTDEKKITAITTYVQNWVNEQLWAIARKTAMDAVDDPTVQYVHMADPEIDIQTVINRLTATIAQLTADIAVKDALIEALRKNSPELEVVALEDQDDA